MYVLNMYVLQCILCASEQKYFRIYSVLQIKIIIIIIIQVMQRKSCDSIVLMPNFWNHTKCLEKVEVFRNPFLLLHKCTSISLTNILRVECS